MCIYICIYVNCSVIFNYFQVKLNHAEYMNSHMRLPTSHISYLLTYTVLSRPLNQLPFQDYLWGSLPRVEVKWKSLSCVHLFATPWNILSMEFSRVRILEWVAFPFSRGPSQPRDWTRSPALQADSLPAESPGKPLPRVTFLQLLPTLKTRADIAFPWTSTTGGRFEHPL